MIRNIQITKKGSESDDSGKTLYTSPNSWSDDGANLVLYKNSSILKKDEDYKVQDEYTVKLLSSAKTSDELNFVITQIVDPSDMYSHDERMYQLDKINKKFEGKAQTSIEKRTTEETIPSKFIIHSNDIWTSTIDSDPIVAAKENTAIAYTEFTLTEDKTVADEKGWYATDDETLKGRLVDWIPSDFGKNYIIRLYDNLGEEIPSSDVMNWRWDYQAGYLIIENYFEYETPFKISGYRYSGRYGVGSLAHWKEPVFAISELPLYNNDDGDIRLIQTENKLYRYDSLKPGWDPLNYGSSSFADPVLSKDDLPLIDNVRGEVRLVLDESNLYVWDDAYANGSWILLTGQGFNPSNFYSIEEMDNLLKLKANLVHNHDTIYLRDTEIEELVRWRPSRADFNDLPPYTENRDGDIILTRDNNTIYRWYTDDPNDGQGHWDAIVQSNFAWKTPVDVKSDLPISSNSPGDARFVFDDKKIYFWTGSDWVAMVSEVSDHNHDERYMLKTQMYWREPVDTFDDLPEFQNMNGDVRMTLNTNTVYRWSDDSDAWVKVVQKSSWLEPVATLAELANGEENQVIYVAEYNQLYVYKDTWIPIEQVDNSSDLYYSKDEIDVVIDGINDSIRSHTHDGVYSEKIDYNDLLNIPTFSWKNPVVDEIDLPTENNVGDARIVLNPKSIYVWTGIEWELVSSGNFEYEHNHDERYYKRDAIDSIINQMSTSLISMIEGKADVNHNHNEDYYLKDEVDIMLATGLAEKSDKDHTHDWTHNHDDRYPTFSDLSVSGGEGKVHWDNIINKPESISDAWCTPVQYENNLPDENNNTGDLRLVLDTSDVWRWDGDSWMIVGHWQGPQVDHWDAPVETNEDLPYVNNFDGDVRLVIEENKLYRWDEDQLTWIALATGAGSSSSGSNGTIDDNDVTGPGYDEIQVYLNGIQGIENEDWEFTSSTGIRILAEVNEQDIISIIIIDDSVKRYDFRGGSEGGPIEVNLSVTFFRKEIELNTPTSLITLPQEYNPGQKDLLVWLNGVLQRAGKDYIEISSTIFNFTRMLDIGDRLIIVILGFTAGDSYAREDQETDEDQHEFNLIHEYATGTNQLLVYLNGQLQTVMEDYIETSEDTVRFLDDREIAEGDYVTFIILKGLAIGDNGGSINYASDLKLGWPSDDSWSDGYVALYSEMNVADAIDEINEAILELVPNDLTSLANIQLTPSNIEFASGFVSDGNANIEGSPGDYFDYLTKDRDFILSTPENSFNKADQGIIRLFVNGIDVDQFNLGEAFVEDDRDGSQTSSHYGISSQGATYTTGFAGTGGAIRNSSNGYIQVMSVQKYGYKKIQKGSLQFKLYNGILRHGYNYIYVTHSYDDVVNTTQQFKLFIDTKHIFPDFTGTQTLFEQTISSEKYVSGVRYYSIGDSFRTTFNISNIAYTVYSAEPITIDMPGLQPLSIEYNDPNLGQISDPPHINDIAEYKGTFVLNEFNEFSIDGVVDISTHTPFGDGEDYKFVSKNRLINTYTNGSSSLVEYFRDEIFRMPVDDYDVIPTQRSYIWDNKAPLTQDDALLFDKGLRYANMSFIDFLPIQAVDYSGFSGPQYYYRAFFQNTPHNNGIFVLDGIIKNDLIYNKILIDIKLPTQTGWLSLNKYYEVSEFDGEDGDGCLIDVVDNQFYYSSGTFSTAYSGYTIIIKITLPNDLAPVMKYLELKW